MTPPPEDHVDVGAYVLGVLDPAERAAFEEHLAGCAQCVGEVAELGGLEPILAEYRAAGAPGRPAAVPTRPDEAMLGRLVGEVTAARRRGRRRRLVLVAAAAVLVLAGPAVTAVVTADTGHPVRAVAQQFSGTDAASGATATVGVEGAAWGSRITLRLSHVPGPLTCDLVAVSRTGEQQTVTSWSVPAAGYGAPGAPATLNTTGGAGLRPGDIDHFEVRTLDGAKVLVTVPAAPAA
ncbi:zf-HC2 domain-containing protein [Kitasatospora sp. NBC_00315]|uniref:zf-HC2 domain-containing protein n=1 Tax=Kitasatospora sp. NBC_00315 TaxID=2975963 RepID=UPI00324B3AC2